MFKRKQTYEDMSLQASAQTLLDKMANVGPDSDEFPELMTRYERIEAQRKSTKKAWSVSPDTLVIAAANIIGIVIVVVYEKKDVWTTKAFNQTLKLK